LTRGLSDIARVEPWMVSFNPGTSTLQRLLELTRRRPGNAPDLHPPCQRGQAADRSAGPHLRALRRADDALREVSRIDGCWWQFSLTERSAKEPSALSLLKISRDRNGALEVNGRSWREDGRLSARYWSEAVKEREGSSGVFYYWNGERPLDPNAPQLYGVAEIRLDSPDRASGYFTTRADGDPAVTMRTSGVYWRADPDDLSTLDGRDDQKRAALLAERLAQWKAVRNA
jgi:hypothetical protein